MMKRNFGQSKDQCAPVSFTRDECSVKLTYHIRPGYHGRQPRDDFVQVSGENSVVQPRSDAWHAIGQGTCEGASGGVVCASECLS